MGRADSNTESGLLGMVSGPIRLGLRCWISRNPFENATHCPAKNNRVLRGEKSQIHLSCSHWKKPRDRGGKLKLIPARNRSLPESIGAGSDRADGCEPQWWGCRVSVNPAGFCCMSDRLLGVDRFGWVGGGLGGFWWGWSVLIIWGHVKSTGYARF